ncbi:MAG: hypothetical protein PHZ02_00740 [Desulfocapsaceae bacterium]|nr:hypothetical protein [Desulfocapsaceae bacterium]
MIYDIPEEIINETKLCLYNHGCLSSVAIFPQGVPTGKKGMHFTEVKKKSYFLGKCSYCTDIINKENEASTLCFCPVRCEIFNRYGK